jgi:hypothetical protein
MVRVDLRKTIIATSLVALAISGLTGCASPSSGSTVPGTYPDVSLAETKSPAQLLRNEAASRLPEAAIGQIIEAQDTSVACLSENDDPEGTVRSWHSIVNVLIVDDGTFEVNTLANDLVASFVDQGWQARSLGGNATSVRKFLESADSLADIQVSGLAPDPNRPSTAMEDAVDQPTVQIEVHGPCVRTAGATSDEVTALEK